VGAAAHITDRIASVSLTTILLVLVLLTVVRAGLQASRVAVFRSTADLLESAIIAVVLVFLLLRPFVVQSFYIPSGSMQPTLWEGDRILVNKFVYRLHPPRQGDIVVFRAPESADPAQKDFIKRVVGLPGDVIEVREGYVVVGTGADASIYTSDSVYSHLCDLGSVDTSADGGSPRLPRLRLMTDAIHLGDKRISPEAFAQAVGRMGAPVRIQPGQVVRNGEVLHESYVAEDVHYHMAPTLVAPGHLFVMGDNRNDSRDSHSWGTFPVERVVGRADLVFWPLRRVKRISHQ
jgi:signal peptidase I, bacterial type